MRGDCQKAGIVSEATTAEPHADISVTIFSSVESRRQAAQRQLHPAVAGYLINTGCGRISVDFMANKRDDPQIQEESQKAYRILRDRYGCE